MESKQHILSALRRSRPPAVELPALEDAWIAYPDRKAQFAAMLESVGGRVVRVDSAAAINAHLSEQAFYSEAKRICSLVPAACRGNVDLDLIADPHELADIDVAILPGEFAVAENAAVWVTDRGVKHRVIYFLVQHLVLVVPATEILDNMHQAYDRLAFDGPRFGVFISGPSKTADIEQSLVIGAHGPRSLTVFVAGGEDRPSAVCS